MTSGGGGEGRRILGTRPGVGFKSGDFVKNKLEGATVERPQSCSM